MGLSQWGLFPLGPQLVGRWIYFFVLYGQSAWVSAIFLNLILLQVEKQCAHFFGVTISDEQAESGIVVRVTSAAQSKFKVDRDWKHFLFI